MLTISAADPLNLTGVITPGQRVPAQANNRVLYRDGVPLAAMIAGEVLHFGKLDLQLQQQVRQMLIRKTMGQVVQFQSR